MSDRIKQPLIVGTEDDSDFCLVGPDIGGGLVASPIVRLHDGAYANLFASAPELLALLQEVFSIGDRLVDDVYGHEFVRNAKATIAKANGEQP